VNVPVDVAVVPHALVALEKPRPNVVVVPPVRRSARDALLDAELRGAPDHELRLLEEAAIAANISRIRSRIRAGESVTAAERAHFERDCELLRRFPNDRRGIDGAGWFHLAHRNR
jgi:hypothetical protein